MQCCGSYAPGGQWLNLSEPTFPKWQSVYYYFRKWKLDGTLNGLNAMLNMYERRCLSRESTPSLLSIDSQLVKGFPFTSKDKGIDKNHGYYGKIVKVFSIELTNF